MTAIYIWLACLTVLQLIQWAILSFKVKVLEEVFKKMDDLTDQQKKGFADSFNKVQELHNRVSNVIMDFERKLNKP